jgi:pimeloyl-ACP methyl ester carboxylesterase
MVPTADDERLASTEIAASPPGSLALYALHGIYGRGRNWAAVARHLAVRRPDWGVVLIDLRLHGHSPACSPPHTVEACAGDVLEFERDKEAPPRAILGHSFGGKVALAFAARTDVRPLQVWIIDSTPEARAPEGAAWEMLHAARSLPPDFASRHQAVTGLEGRGVAPAVAAWMATNLSLADGRYRWRLDFGAMKALLEDFFRTDLWDVVEQPPAATEFHFVKALGSDTLSERACDRLTAARGRHGQVHLHRVQGGHWLNTDNPGAVLGLLERWLPRR